MIQAVELRIGNKVNRPLKDDNENRFFVEYTILAFLEHQKLELIKAVCQ